MKTTVAILSYLAVLLSGGAVGLAVETSVQPLSCTVSPDRRTDCGYIGTSREECESKGCCWSPVDTALTTVGVPWCFYRDSTNCNGYEVQQSEDGENGLTAKLQLKAGCRIHGPDVLNLKLEAVYETDTRIHVKITDADKARFEVPGSQVPRPKVAAGTTKISAAYKFSLGNDPFSFKVTRKSDGEVIFDTSASGTSMMKPLIFEEQYLEISTRLPPNANIYGLGEVVHALRRDPHNTRQTMWARDAATPKDQNVYGSHPFYIEMRDGKAHGVFLLNSNGMDVLIRPGALTYKTIGGVLDFYIFVGPTPADVVHQYMEVIGNPHMIPYWVLGFHHCRYGFKNLGEVKQVVQKYRENGIPLETMWTDIDYMDAFKDFTLDPKNFAQNEMQSFVADLHNRHQHYVLILDPAIKVEQGYRAYTEGVEKGLFIKKPDGNVFVGKVWPGLTAFPDFFNPGTQEYWTKYIREFMKLVPVDGWWIDMNEPANFCDGPCSGLDDDSETQPEDQLIMKGRDFDAFDPNRPSYRINNDGREAPLDSKTVSADARHFGDILHYDVHNLYGHSESIMTRQAVLDINPGKRPFVLSRSTFSGTGVHAGHWTGDNWSTWEHLYLSIPGMLNFQFFGIPLVGADICGFIGDVSEELCARWMQLGAFYPFSRNHNTINAKPQEPYLWESVAKAAKNALNIRYSILPYYYTLFYQAHKFGSTVVRPLFFEFPEDKNVLAIDREFLVGSSILISPVLEEWARTVNTYFPAGLWYDWYTHKLVVSSGAGDKEGSWMRLNAGLDHIPVHVRGGHIIPVQKPEMTVFESRQRSYELIVPFDHAERASGDLYVDDGETNPISETAFSYIDFLLEPTATGHELQATGIFNYEHTSKLENVYVLGLKAKPKSVLVGGEELKVGKWEYDSFKAQLHLKSLDIAMDAAFTISWSL